MTNNPNGLLGYRRLIGNRDFYRQVAVIVIPMIIQNTVTNIVSLLDNLMVGHLGTIPLSSVAIINQIIFVFNLCLFGGLSGVGIFATQFAGAKDHDGVRHCFRFKWLIILIMCALSMILLVTYPDELVNLYLKGDTSPEDAQQTLLTAKQYLQYMLFGLLPFAVSMTYSSTLRELGETKIPMFASITAILTNFVFNYLLIFGKCGLPELGVGGAAIATVISRFVEMLIICIYTHAKHAHFPFIIGAYRSFRIPAKLVSDIIKRGMPLLLNEMLWSSSMAVLMQCYSLRGLNVIAATNIAQTTSNIFNVVFFSTGASIGILVGHHLGANQFDKALDTAWKLTALSVCAAIFMSIFTAISAPFIPMLYNTTPVVRRITTLLLWCNALASPFYAYAHSSYFIIRSGGRTFITMLMDCGFSWFILVPVAWYIGNKTSLAILPFYFILQMLEGIKVITGYLLIRSGVWIRNIVA